MSLQSQGSPRCVCLLEFSSCLALEKEHAKASARGRNAKWREVDSLDHHVEENYLLPGHILIGLSQE